MPLKMDILKATQWKKESVGLPVRMVMYKREGIPDAKLEPFATGMQVCSSGMKVSECNTTSNPNIIQSAFFRSKADADENLTFRIEKAIQQMPFYTDAFSKITKY